MFAVMVFSLSRSAVHVPTAQASLDSTCDGIAEGNYAGVVQHNAALAHNTSQAVPVP